MMNELELKILDFISENFRCAFLDSVLPIITSLGNEGIIWIITALILLIIPKTRKIGFSVALALIIGLLVGNVFLKNVVARIRPYDLNTEVELLVAKLSDFSFPSGHTLASFEAATVLMIRDKRMGIPALVLAIIIAFSRLYLYVHYPSDVIAGMLLGIGIAFLSCFIVDKIFRNREIKK